MQLLLSLAHSFFHLVLVACTRLYKSLCQLVCPSVSPWVRLLVPLYFFGVFEQFKGKKIRPTVRLTDTVTCRVACMRLIAIGLVFYPIHSFENVVGADMPRCFSLSGANTKPDLIDSYVLWASWESFCLEMENSGTFTFYHTFGVKNMIRQSHRQTEWADSHKLRKIKIFPYLKVLNVNWPSEIT